MVTRNRELRTETQDYMSKEISNQIDIVNSLLRQEEFYKDKLAETRKRREEANLVLRSLKNQRKILQFNNLSTPKEPVNPSGRKPSIFR